MNIQNRIDDAIHKEARAVRAERAFKHEGVKEALDSCRQMFHDAIELSAPSEQGARETAYAGLLALRHMEQYYLSIIADGKVNEHERKVLESRLEG